MAMREFLFLCGLLLCAPVLAAPGETTASPQPPTPHALVLQSGHQMGVVAIAFSPDSGLAASLACDNADAANAAQMSGEIKLWNARTGELIRNFSGVSGSINSLAFAPDGQTLATAQSENAVRLWNVASGQMERKLWAPRPVAHLVWTHQTGLVGAEGTARGITGKLFLWNNTLSQIRFFLPSQDAKPLDSHGFDALDSPLQVDQAGAVLSVKTARAITTWDGKTRRLLARIALNNNDVESPFFVPTLARDGRTLAMSVGGHVMVWQARTGQRVASWPLNFRQTLRFAPDGQSLFCRDFGNGTVERRQTLTGKLLSKLTVLQEDQGGVGALAFSPDARVWVAAGNFNPSMIWWHDSQKFAQVESLNTLTDLFFYPQSDLMGWSQNNGAFYFWNWKTGRLSHFFALPDQESFRGLNGAFSPDDARLFVAVEAELRCLDARSGALQWKTPPLGQFADVNMAVAPDGQSVATTAMGDGLRFWDAATGRELPWRAAPPDTALPRTGEAHGALAYSADGQWLVIGGDSNAKAALFDVEQRRFVRRFDTYNGADVRFSADAKTIVIANGFSPSIEVFDALTGARLWRRDAVFGYSFSNNKVLVLRTDKGWVSVVALTGQTAKETPGLVPIGEPELAENTDNVWLVPTPDKRFWVGKGSDEVLRFWSATTGELMRSLANPALPDRVSPHWLAFSPDGLYTGSPGIETYVRHRNGDHLLTPAQSRAFFRATLPPLTP